MIATDFDPRVKAPGCVPPGLDDMEPGPVLGAYLSAIDVDQLSGYDRVVVLRAHQKMATHFQAKVYTDMAAVTRALEDPQTARDSTIETAASEIAAALCYTRRKTDIELSFALDLHRRHPRLNAMLASGVIDVARARIIDNSTLHLSDAAADNVIERITDAAPHMTTGQLAARIRKLCIDAGPNEAKERYEHAVAGRKVVAEPNVDGSANLKGLDLPPDKVAAISRKINEIAKGLRRDGETRTMDQLRADIYIDLLEGTQYGAGAGGSVHLTVDLDTLAGLADHPGELNGFAPVIADIAHQVTEEQTDAEWRYTVYDTATGEHIHDGATRRRPTATDRRHIQARDRTCIHPGCRMPSIDCDIDHTTPYSEGGATCPCNAAPLCRYHHRLKDQGWTYRPTPGHPHYDYEWISRLGHTYHTRRAPP